MKIKLNYILLLVITVAISACSKQSVKTAAADTSFIPQGNFIGTFTLIHKNTATSKLDTASALITMAFTLNTASYSVAGDTTKIQAPSHGTYTADGTYLNFTDATVTKTNINAAKKHLTGEFLYTYDGQTLHVYGSSDTLNYNYQMTAY